MKWFAMAFGLLFLSGCGSKAPDSDGAALNDSSSSTSSTEETSSAEKPFAPTPPPPPTPPPSAAQLDTGEIPDMTSAEKAYLNIYISVFKLVNTAEDRLKIERRVASRSASAISQSKADIDAAWNLHHSNFNIPLRFAVADSYLSSGLAKERAALLRLDMGIYDEQTRADYVDAGEILKKSLSEMIAQLKSLKEGSPTP